LTPVVDVACALLFLWLMIGASFIRWRVKLPVATLIYFVGVGMLSLWPGLLALVAGKMAHLDLDRGWFGILSLYLIGCGVISSIAYLGVLAHDEKDAQPERTRKTMYLALILMVASALTGAAVYIASAYSPKIKVSREIVDRTRAQDVAAYYYELHDAILNRIPTGEGPERTPIAASDLTEAEARQLIAERVAVLNRSDNPWRNPYTGEPFKEEDSPGNYQLVMHDDKLELFYYDANYRIANRWPISTKLAPQDTPQEAGK
jgi:hypothetical protein